MNFEDRFLVRAGRCSMASRCRPCNGSGRRPLYRRRRTTVGQIILTGKREQEWETCRACGGSGVR